MALFHSFFVILPPTFGRCCVKKEEMALKVAVLLSCVLGIGTLTLEDPEDGGKHWVVIVAGSNGWYNYRHQVRKLCTPIEQ